MLVTVTARTRDGRTDVRGVGVAVTRTTDRRLPPRVPSYGPNGTHWQPDTPWMHDSTVASVEVDCTWSAIKAALLAVTAEQAAAGFRILVRPGTLNGGSSNSTVTISGAGSAAWVRRVLVRPRDGYGSVLVAGARIRAVHGVTWAGFINTAGGWRLEACQNGGASWLELRNGTWFKLMHRAGGAPLLGAYAGEIVRTDVLVSGGDPADVWPPATDGGPLDNIVAPVLEGWHLSPNYRPAGSTAHTDTLQLEPYAGARVRGGTLRDMALFGSSNCAVQLNALDDAVLDHSYLTECESHQARYPWPAGADATNGNCLNGDGHRLTLRDCVVIGNAALGAADAVREVTGTLSKSGGRAPTGNGAWIVDPTLSDDTYAGRPVTPTPAYLASIWT